MRHADLVVVGAGITALAAAWEASRQGADVVVLEADERAGGKLRSSPVAGLPLDEAADAFLARVPDAVELCAELGIDSELVAPATGRAFVWVGGELRPLPEAQLMGVPTDLDVVAASGILSPTGLARAKEDLARPDDRPDDADGDEPVGALVRRRLGEEVLDRFVAPLVGGIWAGDCDRLSLRTATPALAEARQRAASLIQGAAEVRAAAAVAAAAADAAPAAGAASGRAEQPVFLAPRGGTTRLVEALVDALDDRIHMDHEVSEIARPIAGERGRWRVDAATPAGTDSLAADAVIITAPTYNASPLVEPHCPQAAATLAEIEYSSVALVSLAVPRDGIDHPLDGSGFLVPPSEGRSLTACSWTSSKWPHLTDDTSVALLRASTGRDGNVGALPLTDEDLARELLAELREMIGLRARPLDIRVRRWVWSFPQPRPGHLDRVADLEAALARDAPGLLVAGAWARGVGIPACIRAGRRAARAALG